MFAGSLTLRPGVASSSTMVSWAELVPMKALPGLDRTTENVSSASSMASEVIGTLTGWVVVPAGKVTTWAVWGV